MHILRYDAKNGLATFSYGDSNITVEMGFEDAHALSSLFDKVVIDSRTAGHNDVIRHVNNVYGQPKYCIDIC